MGCRTLLVLTLGFSGVGLICGCGSSTATVSGEVTVDNRPLQKGVISFIPPDGKAATASVEKGKYQLRTGVGNNKVQISAPLVVGKRKEYDGPDAPMVEITEESLPARYNSSTELTFEVKSGSNTKNWSVDSKTSKR